MRQDLDKTPDGRPQGPTTPHPLPARPYYTTKRPAMSCIVGAGAAWMPGGGTCGQYRLNKEEGGSMMERDGRPQGPTTPHPLPTRPYDTTKRPAKPCIVGAGEDVDVGMGPLWLPVRTHHHISS